LLTTSELSVLCLERKRAKIRGKLTLLEQKVDFRQNVDNGRDVVVGGPVEIP
jgi:hypothetical protein